MYFLIALVILLFSHLTIDRDIPQDMKVVAWVVFLVLALIYVVFGLIL